MHRNPSRRELYAAGEPFGDACTREEAGRVIYGGGGGGSSSSASTNTNMDNRVAVQDGIGLSNSSGNSLGVHTTNVTNITDGGIVARALQTVDVNNATNAEGFSQLLAAAEGLFNRGENLIGLTQKHVADAYSQATTDKAGTIDNRTMIVLAVVAGVAIVASKGFK